MKFYRFIFADGYYCICAGMSQQELAIEESKHGKLIVKKRES